MSSERSDFAGDLIAFALGTSGTALVIIKLFPEWGMRHSYIGITLSLVVGLIAVWFARKAP